jgi:hypothetical protein
LQKLNRLARRISEATGHAQASDFNLMRPGKKPWKNPYRSEGLTWWRQIGPFGPGT